MAGREIYMHRRNLILTKILTGGVAAVFFALVNMVILPGAGMEVRAEDPRYVTNLQDLRDAFNDTTCTTAIIKDDMTIDYGTGESAPMLERSITINLNGKHIVVNGTFVDIKNGLGNLTIVDNPLSGTSVTDTESDVTADKNKYGNTATYDYDTNTLIYYVTEPSITSVGKTSESVKEHIVVGAGTITGTKNEHAVFYMEAGTLTIKGGMIAGSQSRAVHMSGSSILNIEGGYLCGNNKDANADGGAVFADGVSCSLNMSGGVIAGNTAENGGAIYLASAPMNMTGGIIAGNVANVDGGGIFVNGSGNFAMSDVAIPADKYITNNISSLLNYYNNRGGGGVAIDGNGTFTLNNGYITGNHAASGGGIYLYNKDSSINASKFVMNNGYISSNRAEIGEGGGIRVGGYCLADFNGGYITNNITNTSEHWGGGGIFIAEGASGFAEKVLVKNNSAEGFGGGVAGCSTGQIYINHEEGEDRGVAIYTNTAEGRNLSGGSSAKHDDHSYAARNDVFINSGFQDYFSMLYSYIADIMLGGGSHNWSGSIDGEAVTIATGNAKTSNSVAGLSSSPYDSLNPTERYKRAEEKAVIFVTGNSSNTHGGGILCNGYMIFGKPPSTITASTRLEVHAKVQYLDWASFPLAMSNDQFSFKLMSDNGVDEIMPGTNYDNGEVTFKRRLMFPNNETYTYEVVQTTPEISNGKIDRTKYRVTATVSDYSTAETIYTPEGNPITVSIRKISNIKVYRQIEGSSVWDEWNEATVSHEGEQYNHAVAVYLTDPANPTSYSFTNYNLTPPPPATEDSTNNSQPVTSTVPENQEVITQTAEGELPQTGQNWMSVILLACAGCLCMIIGIALKRVEHEWD